MGGPKGVFDLVISYLIHQSDRLFSLRFMKQVADKWDVSVGCQSAMPEEDHRPNVDDVQEEKEQKCTQRHR
jgi:hypothetical protein